MSKLVFSAYTQIDQNRFRERYGLNFEDFRPGQKFKHRPGYTFTQQDNIDECLGTLNQAMLHYDACYAARTEFKKPLIVTTAIVQRVIGMAWKTFNRRKAIRKWSYINMRSPVFDGDTLYAESEVLSVNPDSEDPECGLAAIHAAGRNQHDEIICEMAYDALIYRKDSLPFARLGY